MNEIYAVLDIGSATIELLVGEVVNSNLHVLFAKKVPSHGVKKGIVEDDRLLIRDIQALVQEANEFLEGEIKRVGIMVPTIRAKLYQSNSSISLNNEEPVTNEDIVRGLQLSKRIKISNKEEIICVETNGRNAAIAKIGEMGVVVTSAVRNACRTPHKGVLVNWERNDDGWILKCKEKNGDRVFDIEIGKMSKSNMIKYCRDEWIVIPAETMRRLRSKGEGHKLKSSGLFM